MAPLAADQVPAGQGVQLVAPAAANVPAGQNAQYTAAPDSAARKPLFAAHSESAYFGQHTLLVSKLNASQPARVRHLAAQAAASTTAAADPAGRSLRAHCVLLQSMPGKDACAAVRSTKQDSRRRKIILLRRGGGRKRKMKTTYSARGRWQRLGPPGSEFAFFPR